MDCVSDTDLLLVGQFPNLIDIPLSDCYLAFNLNEWIILRQLVDGLSLVRLILPSNLDIGGFLHDLSDSIHGVIISGLLS